MKSDISGQKQKKKAKKTVNVKWIVTIFFTTVLISGVFSTISNMLLGQAGLAAAFAILLVIILIGILFDIVGVAVTAADVKPFHSMAAHRVPGAQDALKLLKNAEKVSSFCNDVVGDICGVISGAASATIAAKAIAGRSANPFVELLLSALVAALTVGGKAFGKTFAIHMSTPIVQTTAKALTFFKTLPAKFRKKR